MPNYTVTINDQAELDALAFDRQRVNNHRQNQEPALPVLTEPQFIQWIVRENYLPNIKVQHRQQQRADVATAWEDADDVKKVQVEALLGLSGR